jgi:hypothetical protein
VVRIHELSIGRKGLKVSARRRAVFQVHALPRKVVKPPFRRGPSALAVSGPGETVQRWTEESGQKRQVDKQQKVRPWWRTDAVFEKGKAGIAVPSKGKLPALIDSLISAVKAVKAQGSMPARFFCTWLEIGGWVLAGKEPMQWMFDSNDDDLLVVEPDISRRRPTTPGDVLRQEIKLRRTRWQMR